MSYNTFTVPARAKQKQKKPLKPARPSTRRVEPEKDIFSWKAPGRPFKRRDRDFWITLLAIVAVVSLVLYIIEGIIPVILAISLLFLFYILSTVKPEKIEYRITNRGVKIADKRTDWALMTRFWFSRRFESELLVFEMVTIPGRLELVINPKDKDGLRKALADYLIEEEAPATSLDKAADWFSKKLPGN